jgi:hypothetical protein
MIGGIVRLVLTGRDAAACGFASRLQHGLRSPAFGGAIGMRDPAGYRQRPIQRARSQPRKVATRPCPDR